MHSETSYRIALLTIMTFTMLVAAYYRVQAATSGERISHEEEGYLFAILLRLAGLCVWVSLFAYLLFPASVAWGAMPLPAAVRWSGLATGSIAPLLMYWTLSSLGKNLTDTVVTRSSATLVTHGPYRWIRHPFYVTAALFLLSATLLSASALIGIGSLVVLMLLAMRTPREEQMLIDKFGEGYRQYMARTGRFFPHLGKRPVG